MNVILNSCVIKENLPFPFVHYPSHYGTFFSFSEHENSDLYFCECNKVAIENYLKQSSNKNNSNFLRNIPLDSSHFPDEISKLILKKLDIEKILKYKKELCHRCNLATPYGEFCVPMYGSKFKQNYGWYINQNFYRLGISPLYKNIINSNCPDDLQDKILHLKKIQSTFHFLGHDTKSIRDRHKEADKITRYIDNYVENITREEFGVRKIGDRWISETILFNIVRNIFSEEEIIRHYRPDWLEGLELDIYIPNQKLAFEYQGQQHYYPIKSWGGKKALKALQGRDQKKIMICKKENVRLVHVKYTESLDEQNIQRIMQSIEKKESK